MKLFFVADIHGSEYFLGRSLEAFEKERADILVLVGDLLYHGPRNPFPEGYNPARVAEILNEVREKIFAIRGNCDSDVDQMVLSFPMLNDHGSILAEGKRIFLSHGHIYSPDNLPPLKENDIFVSAHTHIPMIRKQNGVYVFNPGSISLPKGGSTHSYGLFDGEVLEVKALDGKCVLSMVVEDIRS
ncbi:MAG TPA: phosphodiesterase [Deltaproteobacteria bacterium]|nr:phosphodiesterase [Deltaproteobacteria bacterium]